MSLFNRLPRLHLAIYSLYTLIAVLMTWPLVTVISTHFAGYPFGDAHEMTRHIWWIKHALQSGQPLIFQPLLAYPDGLQGVILWSNPLQFFPAWLLAFFLPLPAAYNLFVLLTLALNGWAAYWLVWKLTNNRYAAFMGGLVFMIAPVMQGHLAGGHGGLLVQWPLPLLVYFLLGLCELLPDGGQLSAVSFRPTANRQPPTARHSVLATLFFCLTPLGHTLQLIYAVLPLVAVLAVTLLLRRDWLALRRLVIVTAAGTILLGLFLLPVFSATFGASAYTAEGGGVDFSADLLGIVTPSFNHPLYGQLDYTRRVLGVNIVEGSSYIGIVAGLLALAALWKVRSSRWWLGLGVVAWLLSLGPLLKVMDAPLVSIIGGYETRLTLPWALLYDLPGFSLARTPGRFSFLLALAVAGLTGYGYAALSDQLSTSSQKPTTKSQPPKANRQSLLVTAFLALLILFDYQFFWPLPTYDARIPQPVVALAVRADVRAVFDVPWDNLLAAKDALWLQTAHQKPMIAGQVTRRTPVSPAKLSILEHSLDPALLREAGADVVIVHRQYDAGGTLALASRRQFGEPLYEDERLAVFAVPEAGDKPQVVEIFSQPGAFTNGLQTAVYSAESGWLPLELTPTANNRALSLRLDGKVIQNWAAGLQPTTIWLPLTEPGYHSIAFEATPTCPDRYSPGLVCVPPSLRLKTASAFMPAAFGEQVVFERGVSVATPPLMQWSLGRLRLSLWWQFDEARGEQDIRFIKVLDERGEPVVGIDETLGDHVANSGQIETVSLDLPADLPMGSYSVYVGWYTYPDLTRFKVLSAVPGGQDGWALIGSFRVSHPANH